jgi:integrase
MVYGSLQPTRTIRGTCRTACFSARKNALMQNKRTDEKPNDDAKDQLIAELRAENERLRELQGKALSGELTPAKIAKLKNRGRYRDQNNLFIQVPSTGSKSRSWLFGWTKNGKFKQFALGRSYPDGSIQWAREEAQYYRQVLQDDRDPEVARKNRQEKVVIASGLTKTVRQVGEEWFETKIAPKAPGYANRVEGQLKNYVYATIGHMLIQNVDQNTILNSGPRCVGLDHLCHTKWPTYNQLQQHLERIFNYARFKKYYSGENPAAKATLQYLLPDRGDVYERKPRASLPIEEMYAFLQQLRVMKDRSVRKAGHSMLALLNEAAAYTGVRMSELRLAQQKEIDTKTWNVPWQRRKFGKQKKARRPIRPIPITPSFQRVLDQAAAKRKQIGYADGPEQLIFPSDKPGHIGKIIPVQSPARFIRDRFPGLKLQPHGFRSTLSDFRRKRSFLVDWYKIQVDHNVSEDIEERYGTDLLLQERRQMMMQYDTFVSNPPPKVTGGKVVAINNRRRTA